MEVEEVDDGDDETALARDPAEHAQEVLGLKLGVRRFWMQPGAENPEAIELAESQGASVIHDGPCLLVVLGYRE